MLNAIPFVWVQETYLMGVRAMLEQLVLNVMMFVTVGLLLPLASSRLQTFGRTVLCGLVITLLIETLQYFTGRSADIDDVIMNAAGSMIGYAVYKLLAQVY